MRTRTCPRCNTDYVGWPALSRRDNRTDICPGCDTEEALVDVGLVKRGARVADLVLAREKRFRERLTRKEEER